MSELVPRCNCTPVCQTDFDLKDTPPSSAVVRAIAAAKDTPATEIPPLYDVIDLEALDRLVEHANAGGKSPSFSLQLSVDDLEVNVYSDGEVVVCDDTR